MWVTLEIAKPHWDTSEIIPCVLYPMLCIHSKHHVCKDLLKHWIQLSQIFLSRFFCFLN